MPTLDGLNLIAIDIETTGTNPFIHDAIAVALVPLNSALPEFEVFISHEQLRWNEFARTNFKKFESMWHEKRVSADSACTALEDYIRSTFSGNEVTLIGHNVGFDLAFLRKLAFQGGREQLSGISHRAIDTHTLLYLLAMQGRIPQGATTSDRAFKHFDLETVSERRHTALYDAQLARSLFLRLTELLVTPGVPSGQTDQNCFSNSSTIRH